jgi:ribosomal protein S18 acetylase RimI-like enzyme
VTALRNDPDPQVGDSVLDNPAWHSLTGPHASLAEVAGAARRYPVDMSPFTALPDDVPPEAWADLARLVGPGATVMVTGPGRTPPPDWERVAEVEGDQLVGPEVIGRPDDEAVVLGADDVAEMLELVARTQPGPFLPRTVELGTYLGIRREGRLVAMAGERLHPPGWIEISAVCTDAGFRGQGLAGRLVRAVVADVRERGATPMLHTGAQNVNAIRLYEQLGFAIRKHPTFAAYRAPA